MAGVPGGFSETRTATEEIQKICVQVKQQVEERTNEKYVEFRAVEYKSQIVAGENFLIKVHVGRANYVHLFVFRALPAYGGSVELRGVQQHKTKDDPLVPFNDTLQMQRNDMTIFQNPV